MKTEIQGKLCATRNCPFKVRACFRQCCLRQEHQNDFFLLFPRPRLKCLWKLALTSFLER